MFRRSRTTEPYRTIQSESQFQSRLSPLAQGHGRVMDDELRLKLLSFNIQVGIQTNAYRHYLTRSWQHFLPNGQKNTNLNRISHLLEEFDLVALQEADGGSLRSGYVSQIEYLAHTSQFPYWYQQVNRSWGRFAKQCNGLLSRYQPEIVEDHKLPGMIPGRGAILVRYGDQSNPLIVIMAHLSLGSRSRYQQLNYIEELISDYEHVVLMGDLNSQLEKELKGSHLMKRLVTPWLQHRPTFPSWRPQRCLDHILVSPSLEITHIEVLNYSISDHLPVAVEIVLPHHIELH